MPILYLLLAEHLYSQVYTDVMSPDRFVEVIFSSERVEQVIDGDLDITGTDLDVSREYWVLALSTPRIQVVVPRFREEWDSGRWNFGECTYVRDSNRIENIELENMVYTVSYTCSDAAGSKGGYALSLLQGVLGFWEIDPDNSTRRSPNYWAISSSTMPAAQVIEP